MTKAQARNKKKNNASTNVHYHEDEFGLLHRCYHRCKNLLLDPMFWFATTITFPVEHGLWHHVPPFNIIGQWLGL